MNIYNQNHGAKTLIGNWAEERRGQKALNSTERTIGGLYGKVETIQSSNRADYGTPKDFGNAKSNNIPKRQQLRLNALRKEAEAAVLAEQENQKNQVEESMKVTKKFVKPRWGEGDASLTNEVISFHKDATAWTAPGKAGFNKVPTFSTPIYDSTKQNSSHWLKQN